MVRVKNRYLLCKIISPHAKSIHPYDITNAIKKSILSLYGNFGSSSASASLVVKYFNNKTKLVQLRIAHAHYRMLWSSLPFVKQVYAKSCQKNVQCILQTLYCGATIRSVQKFIVKYDQKNMKCKKKSRSFVSTPSKANIP